MEIKTRAIKSEVLKKGKKEEDWKLVTIRGDIVVRKCVNQWAKKIKRRQKIRIQDNRMKGI